ncbi:MAG: hypothetical protein NC095_04105 [Muribaculum sp.]|nr:hypothetical protein [Muribaculum sp.]
MFSIFKKKEVRRELLLHLNMPLQPMHRQSLEDQLQKVFKEKKLGEIMGGGTALDEKEGRVESCDIEIDLIDPSDERLAQLVEVINKVGIAKGSILICEDTDEEIPAGTLEGLAYHSNNTDLPQEVYDTYDINNLIEEMLKAMNGAGGLCSYWESPAWTTLYFYGKSYDEMKEKIEPIIASCPLCEKCRIEKIA